MKFNTQTVPCFQTRFSLGRAFTMAAAFLASAQLFLGGGPLQAAVHTATIQNKTGKTANDLHVTFQHKTGNPSCSPMTNTVGSTDGGYSYTFDSGTVANGASATVTWSTMFSPDQITEGYWTLNGTNIGNFGELTVALNYTNNPDGSAVVTLANAGSLAMTYTNLQIFTGVQQTFFTPGAYLGGMPTGQPVEPMVAPSGTLPPGTSALAAFTPSLAGYTAISLQINGGLFAVGSSPLADIVPPAMYGNQALVQVSGDAGRSYALESSADLVNWTPFQTSSDTFGPAVFIDNASGRQNFYRASLVMADTNPPLETPCEGGIFTGGYNDWECINGIWYIVYYDIYACPPDWARHAYRVKQVSTGQPCANVMQESLVDGAPLASSIRNITFDANGAEFASASSGIDYTPDLFPAEGTIELDIATTNSGRWILNTLGAGTNAAGNAVMTVLSSGQVFFAMNPIGGQNPSSLPGVASATVVNDGLFHTVSVSYGSGGLVLYVDGVEEDANPEVAALLVRSTITLGAYPGSAPQSFLGSIRQIRTSAIQGDVRPPANAAQGPFNFVNNTPGTVNDFHAVFTGTGGTLFNPIMTAGPPGAVITASGNQVDIIFPTPVPAGATIGFTVNSWFVPITLNHAWWTVNNVPVGPATPIP